MKFVEVEDWQNFYDSIHEFVVLSQIRDELDKGDIHNHKTRVGSQNIMKLQGWSLDVREDAVNSETPNFRFAYAIEEVKGIEIDDECYSPVQLCNLQDVISKDKFFQVSFNERLKIFIDAVYGLKLLHDIGHFHGNFKPSNILIREDKTGVLADLGSAKQNVGHDADSRISSSAVDGFAMFNRSETADTHDVRAIGFSLLLLLTGKSNLETEWKNLLKSKSKEDRDTVKLFDGIFSVAEKARSSSRFRWLLMRRCLG
jgi:serine/threonine protein kinase